MAFGGFNENQHQAPMAEINVTPMVDVMLVLLVIFIITAPLFTHAIKLELPNAPSQAAPEKPETITLAINAEGKPELQLRADKATRYEVIAQVMSAAQNGGMTKIGFVTDPKEAGK